MMNNLQEFQKKMPRGFESIAVDITGFCNAKCKYCTAGNDLKNNGKFITEEVFEQIIQKMIEYGFYVQQESQNANFHIYSLGEPCLHPRINNILKILNKYNIKTTISTNASYVPEFDKEALESVTRFLISMPGFSQESYDRIHGFNFEKIKDNVVKLRNQVRGLSDGRISFDMSYHIYQFNESEMAPAKEFCEENEIRFAPNYAIMMDNEMCMDYVTGNMSFETLKDVSREIFLGILDRQIKESPRNYCDFQHSFLSVTADGDIRPCGRYKRETMEKLFVGNILTDNPDDIIFRKYHHPNCERCIKAGLTLAKGNECKVWPNSYYDLMKENELIKAHLRDDNLEEKIKFMHLVRDYEQNDYDDAEMLRLAEYLKKSILSEDEKKAIVSKYTRFGMKTYEHMVRNI